MKRSGAKWRREKRRAAYLYRRIYDLMRSGEWEFRIVRLVGNKRLLKAVGHDKDIVGVVDDDTNSILIDYTEDMLPTLLHECLHVLYTEMPELKVQENEHFLVAHMDTRRAKRLLKLLAELLK